MFPELREFSEISECLSSITDFQVNICSWKILRTHFYGFRSLSSHDQSHQFKPNTNAHNESKRIFAIPNQTLNEKKKQLHSKASPSLLPTRTTLPKTNNTRSSSSRDASSQRRLQQRSPETVREIRESGEENKNNHTQREYGRLLATSRK